MSSFFINQTCIAVIKQKFLHVEVLKVQHSIQSIPMGSGFPLCTLGYETKTFNSNSNVKAHPHCPQHSEALSHD